MENLGKLIDYDLARPPQSLACRGKYPKIVNHGYYVSEYLGYPIYDTYDHYFQVSIQK